MMQTYQFSDFGLDAADIQTIGLPPLANDHIRVAIRAISLNYRDWLMVQGSYNPRLQKPFIPCSDASGEIIAVGAEVGTWQVGERVITHMLPGWEAGPPPFDVHRHTLGGPAPGVAASIVDLPANALVRLPNSLDWVTAACLPVAGLTAWNALRCLPKWRKPAWVLTLGSGGVSCFAVQIAKALGHQVIATSSSEIKLSTMIELGADHGINYVTHAAWDKAVLEFCPNGVDLVVEVGGSGTLDRSVNATRLGGAIALIGVLAATDASPNLTKALMKDLRLQGILVGSRSRLEEFVAFVAQHHIKPLIAKHFHGFKALPAAFRYLSNLATPGKVVISL